MAVAAKHTQILIDQYNFSGSAFMASMAAGVTPLETTPFGTDAEEYVAGLPTGSLNHNGYYTGPDAGKIEAELRSRQGTTTPVTVAHLFGTNVDACPAYIAQTTFGTNYTIEMPAAGVLTLVAEWPAPAGLRRGLRLHSGSITATGAGAAVDMGAAGTEGGSLFLFVQSISGGDGVLVDIETSANGSTGWASVGQAQVDAAGVVVESVAGAVSRYARINVTDMGTATALAFVAIWAVPGVTE